MLEHFYRIYFLLSFPFAIVFCKCPQFIALSGVSQSGNITSPGWPSPYPPNAICSYRLQGEAWQGVRISFHYFDLEPPYSAGCLNDYLELNTVDTKGQRTFRGRYCGKQPPAPILVLHPVVELVFRSNHAAHHDGFSASYEFIDEANVQAPGLNATSPCGAVIQGIGGLITSPGFPRGYAAGLDCLWLIRAQYNHVVYLRIQHLEFQGSTANCQKAQLRIYDGYEHSLEGDPLKRFCGDTRFYKVEDDRFILSGRNRLLIRFTTTEPSKPVNDSFTQVGFKLIWSDVEFMSNENCTKSSKFACQEAQVCLSPREKGSSNCPDLKHYCIAPQLVCDGLSNCGPFDSSDERNCSKAPLVLTVVATPLAILTTCLFFCFLCYKRRNRKTQERGIESQSHSSGMKKKKGSGSCCSKLCFCCCMKPQGHKNQDAEDEKCRPGSFPPDSAPLSRGPIYFKSELESPAASDIVSPASGFSDSESDLGNQAPIFCPAHGPVHFVPLRYLSNRHFPMLPVLQEVVPYQSDLYDEGGSLYSTSQNSDMIIYEDNKSLPIHSLENSGGGDHNHGQGNSEGSININMISKPATSISTPNNLGFIQEWRMKQSQMRPLVRRSDAIYISDDNKSSVASSPGRICPRCLEKERSLTQISSINPSKISTLTSCLLEKQNSGVQFDSGIDVVDSVITEPVKNVSFETCTSSDSAISQGFSHRARLFGGWRERFCPPPMVEEVTQTDPNPPNGNNGDELSLRECCRGNRGNNDFCETVTTFGVSVGCGENGNNGHTQQMRSKATDV